MVILPCPSTIARACFVLTFVLFASPIQAGDAVAVIPPASAPATVIGADQAMKQAAADGKYALLCLWQGDTAETQAFRKRFAKAATKEAQRAVAIEVQADAPANAEVIRRYATGPGAQAPRSDHRTQWGGDSRFSATAG
jgi:hypothetical protein